MPTITEILNAAQTPKAEVETLLKTAADRKAILCTNFEPTNQLFQVLLG